MRHRFFCLTAAGGRLIAARLSESYGQQFVVDNRPAASGNIGMELAAHAPADGYTLVVNTTPLVTNQFLYSKVPFGALRDFAPISLLTGTAPVMLVHPALPAKNIRELITRSKKSLAAPEHSKRFTDSGLDIIASTPEEFAAHLKKETEKWGKVIKERGMKAE